LGCAKREVASDLNFEKVCWRDSGRDLEADLKGEVFEKFKGTEFAPESGITGGFSLALRETRFPEFDSSLSQF